ncbi:MAG: hypothetical protein HOV96_40630 [Nonomuraea sp.]|nr:hypothetical protein [Nonomuraea sp.]NUP66558.1 hypothetical protein [Nonomuraea sp.]NUP83852.1 hypothetical protein [Nonomuraea sp.]NUS03270.1 hypothetical protein [Nonomuraea sp.]NUT10966.1 hypothetical protein [Nonomuraea sp.]
MPQNKGRKTKSGDKDKDKSRNTGTQSRTTSDKKPAGSKPQDWKNVPGNQG